MQASNEKLRKRAARMVMLATEVDEATAQAALDRCHSSAKLAIVSLKAGVDAAEAEQLLARADGFVHKAINLAGGQA